MKNRVFTRVRRLIVGQWITIVTLLLLFVTSLIFLNREKAGREKAEFGEKVIGALYLEALQAKQNEVPRDLQLRIVLGQRPTLIQGGLPGPDEATGILVSGSGMVDRDGSINICVSSPPPGVLWIEEQESFARPSRPYVSQ
jgi:hypothetical protein